MKKTLSVLSLVLVTMIAVVQPRCVWACDCDIPPFAGARDQATAIFVGRVERIDNPRSNPITVTFTASTVWKGTLPPTVEILTSPVGVICGYEFQEGQEYLVYARPAGTALMFVPPEEPALEVSTCSRTQLLADAQEDLAALGNGQAPGSGTAEPSQPPAVLPNTAGQLDAPARDLPIMLLGVTTMLAGSVAAFVLGRRVR